MAGSAGGRMALELPSSDCSSASSSASQCVVCQLPLDSADGRARHVMRCCRCAVHLECIASVLQRRHCAKRCARCQRECEQADMELILDKHEVETQRIRQLRKEEKQQEMQHKRNEQHRADHAQATPHPHPPSKRLSHRRITAEHAAAGTAPSADIASASVAFSDLSTEPFACLRCTFFKSSGNTCAICNTTRPTSSDDPAGASSAFQCAVCRKRNKGGLHCGDCSAARSDMVDVDGDETADAGDQVRKSKRQRVAADPNRIYQPVRRFRPQRQAEQQQRQQQQQSAGEEQARSAQSEIDLTGDARRIFMQTDWQALTDELEWIRREARVERERRAREQAIREQQLAALSARYRWPADLMQPALPLARDEAKDGDGKQEMIDIDVDEKYNAF